METMRSTGWSKLSQPSRRISLLRGLSESAKIFSTCAFWFSLSVSPMTLTS